MGVMAVIPRVFPGVFQRQRIKAFVELWRDWCQIAAKPWQSGNPRLQLPTRISRRRAKALFCMVLGAAPVLPAKKIIFTIKNARSGQYAPVPATLENRSTIKKAPRLGRPFALH